MSSETNTQHHHDVILRVARDLKEKPGALLPILHGIQDELGHVPESATPLIAQELNLTRAEVHGVITFYHDFRREPPGRVVIKVCQAESCQAAGGEALTSHVKQRLGVDFHQTTADRACTLEPVYCLGNCALSPSIAVDKGVFGRVSPDRFDAILDEARQS